MDISTSRMYQPFTIRNLEIKNRLAASAMYENGADDGHFTGKYFKRYTELSEGGAGLIITGMEAVSTSGSYSPGMISTECHDFADGLSKIVKIAHANGAKLFVQLQHCGPAACPGKGYDHLAVVDTPNGDVLYHEATEQEIQKIVNDFAAAAVRCKEAGADGVEIHSAHGFLLSSFLSPSTNKRTDKYGGPILNRARFLLEVYRAIRAAVGDYPVGVKFPFSDLNDESTTPLESLYVCGLLDKEGIDFIEITSGMKFDSSDGSFCPVIRKNGPEAPFRAFATLVADLVSVPVISVCGYRTPEFINQTLEETKIAAVSFGRPLVREPDLPKRWLTDPSRAKCISCNGCIQSYARGFINCEVEYRLKQKKES